MGERLGVVLRIGVGVEEVIRGGNHFVANQRVEVPKLHREIIVGQFEVELRDCRTVPRRAIPTEVPALIAEGLSIGAVDAKHVVHPESPSRSAPAIVGLALGEEPKLVEVEPVAQIVESQRAVALLVAVSVGVHAGLNPTADFDVAALQRTGLRQGPGIAQVAAAASLAARAASIRATRLTATDIRQ